MRVMITTLMTHNYDGSSEVERKMQGHEVAKNLLRWISFALFTQKINGIFLKFEMIYLI